MLIPTIEVVGPGGKIIINESDLDAYRSLGYRPIGEPEPQPGVSDADLAEQVRAAAGLPAPDDGGADETVSEKIPPSTKRECKH